MSDTIFFRDDPEMMSLAADCSELEFSQELMHSLLFNPDLHAPYASVTRATEGHGSTGHTILDPRYPECQAPPGTVCFMNAIVKLSNGMQEWIYKVIDYDMCKDSWTARWPD